MPLQKCVDGVMVEMTPDEEAAFVAEQAASKPLPPAKSECGRLLDAFVAIGMLTQAQRDAIAAEMRK